MSTKAVQGRHTTHGRGRLPRDVFDLYLEHMRELPHPLDREGEVRAALAIESAERACLDRILAAGISLPELEKWTELLEASEIEVGQLSELGRYEGDEGKRKLARKLVRARNAERRAERLRARREGSASDRRQARDAAWRARAEAVRDIGLHRERIQDVVARVANDLEIVSSRDEDELRRAEATLGRKRAVLSRLRRDLEGDRRLLDRARNDLAEANLRLVVTLAKAFRRSGVPFGDLVQEGNLGLMRAVDKFDHRVGTRFSTYAAWWIRQAVAREVTRQRETVRLPFGVIDKRRRATRVARNLRQSLGRAPDADEVASELGVSEDAARRALEAMTRSISLSAHVSPDGDRPFDEVLTDEEAPSVDDQAMLRERSGVAHRVLSRLNPREQYILRRRFGFDDAGDETTLREIGEELGLSRERVRQLEAVALEKLRKELASET
jgi:RNA polymerase primary sigma factor